MSISSKLPVNQVSAVVHWGFFGSHFVKALKTCIDPEKSVFFSKQVLTTNFFLSNGHFILHLSFKGQES